MWKHETMESVSARTVRSFFQILKPINLLTLGQSTVQHALHAEIWLPEQKGGFVRKNGSHQILPQNLRERGSAKEEIERRKRDVGTANGSGDDV